MVNLNIKDVLLERPITINSDNDIHRKEVRRGFIAATIYSIVYGFYEYFVVYNYITLHNILGSVGNWIIMFNGMLLVVALATRFSVEKSLMAWLYLVVVEDLFFWIALWIDTGVYPFPAPNWWDGSLTTFRLLGGLGQAIPFWPYTPLYYIPGFTLLIIYYISSYKSAKYGRITAWIIGPFFLGILDGLMPGILGYPSELLALIILIIVPIISYLFILYLLYRNDWKFKEK